MTTRLFVLVSAILYALTLPACAEKRIALIIGNSSYKNVTRLSNPVNDAAAIDALLKRANFDVVETRHNLPATEMRRVLRDFGNKARDADVAFIYYAGHGIEIDGTNYLIPVDATLEQDTDVFDEAFGLDRILLAVEPARKLRLVVLDACRDNPFAKTMKRTVSSRSIGRGLAKIEPTSPNTLIAFAAKAGSTASDGDGKNSPFAVALVNNLGKPGLDLRKAFGFVRDEVMKNTGNRQEPYVYGSLGGDDVALVPSVPGSAAEGANSSRADARRDYDIARAANSKDVWDAFIASYPAGFYTAAAKAERGKLIAEEERLAATQRAKAAEDERTRLVAEKASLAAQVKTNELARAAEEARLVAEKKAADERVKAPVELEKIDVSRDPVKQIGAVAALDTKEKIADIDNTVSKLQLELRRVGCLTDVTQQTWSSATQKAIERFNKHAGTALESRQATIAAFNAVKDKSKRVCPLFCSHGFRADGDQCIRIVCRVGYRVGAENECEKLDVRREAKQPSPHELPEVKRANREATPATSGQVYCNASGCFPVRKGCRVGQRNQTGIGPIQQFEDCS